MPNATQFLDILATLMLLIRKNIGHNLFQKIRLKVKKLTDKMIKELADELGVSKQAVWQKIKKKSPTDLHQFTSTKGNTVYVSVEGQKIIKSMFEKDSSTKSSTNNVNLDDNELTFLRELVHDLQNEKKSSTNYLISNNNSPCRQTSRLNV